MGYSSNRVGLRRKCILPVLLLCVSLSFPIALSGCLEDDKEETIPADYGDYGEQIARQISAEYPYRKAYSEQEKAAGEYIEGELQKLGYTVEKQDFSSADGTGTSSNYIVRITGEGFMQPDETGDYVPVTKEVIVGAHYDTPLGISDSANAPDFDGIQDNSSGIGALLTLAKQLKGKTIPYDVVLVAFGAGGDSFAGARAYTASMSDEEKAQTDAMYCVESIFAGDKLYASAGWSSLMPGQKYEQRRKLYEAYDVVYDAELSSKYGVDLLYNESGLLTDVDGDGTTDVYREVTLTKSDYVPFDELKIPVVFFESYDYNYTTISDMKETRNLNLQGNGGLIRGTNYDSAKILDASLTEGQLQKRINAVAFILLGAIQKGSHEAVSKSDYQKGVTLVPSPQVTPTEMSASAEAGPSTETSAQP